jgi:hypothetical protein
MLVYGYFPKKDELEISPGCYDLRDFRVRAKSWPARRNQEAGTYFCCTTLKFCQFL